MNIFSVASFVSCLVPSILGDGYGHGHSSHGIGTACIVKGSYCQCHYCKCEKGHIHCKGHGHGGGYGKSVKEVGSGICRIWLPVYFWILS